VFWLVILHQPPRPHRDGSDPGAQSQLVRAAAECQAQESNGQGQIPNVGRSACANKPSASGCRPSRRLITRTMERKTLRGSGQPPARCRCHRSTPHLTTHGRRTGAHQGSRLMPKSIAHDPVGSLERCLLAVDQSRPGKMPRPLVGGALASLWRQRVEALPSTAPLGTCSQQAVGSLHRGDPPRIDGAAVTQSPHQGAGIHPGDPHHLPWRRCPAGQGAA